MNKPVESLPAEKLDYLRRRTDKYFSKSRAIIEKFGDRTVTYGVFLRRGVRQVVDREDDHVIADADTAVLAPVPLECRLAEVHLYHRFVLMLCTWACSPTLIGAIARPMSVLYLITVSSFASARTASL